jgi:mono/diheme cytochrome c family protein
MALGILSLMAAIFVLLSFASFMDSRGQVVPNQVKFADHDAVEGKRVFQAYNCMGCHTLLGNGAYLAPDLTRTYAHTGPAWLAAFLPSAGGWPTGPAVQVLLQKPELRTDAGVSDFDAYLAKFPGAAERIRRRGGHPTYMPNLPLSADEVNKLIAFMKYTSAMNTEGWPPKPKVDGLGFPQAKPFPGEVVAGVAGIGSAVAAEASAPADPAALGEKLAAEYACTSCHALDAGTKVGPGWGGLYGVPVKLADGSTVKADDAYLAESIISPDARLVHGYAGGTMPSYAASLDAAQVAALVAYIRTLQGGGQ